MAAAKIQNIPVSQVIEVFRADVGAPGVVHSDIALGLVPQILRQKHRGDLVRVSPDVLIGLRALGYDEDAVHLAPQQQLHHSLLLLQIGTGVAQHDIVPVRPGTHLRVISQFRHELVVDGGHHQANEVRLFHDHGAGHIIGGIAHFITQLDDPLPGLTADLRTAGKGAGDRCIRHTGGLRNIFQRYTFHTASSFSRDEKS